ncbi:hypothetical protein KWH10_19010 [Xanthomonas campestris pv. clerodendri]|uniref:hypothetical protein n=1 Tax=Xanthomonas euvesicatoria TaxID=456327 RepID=UPI001C474C75|nr:hypothetical protein [Xanthomonas euvesicatoria]MBV6791289.1 hypothetical protein [Xanthomonas campestris pv. clerodendri]
MTSDFRTGEQEEGYKELVEHQKLFSAACSVALNGSTRTRATELEVENQQDWDDIGRSGTGVQDEDGHAVALLDQRDSPLVKSKIAQCYAIYKSMCGEEGLDALPLESLYRTK